MPPPSKPLKRYKPMKNGTKGLKRVRLVAARPKPAVPPARRKTLAERSGGVCEIGLPGCVVRAHHAHHRITQKAGGRHGAAKERHDQLSGLLHACWLCHEIVTNPPGSLRVYGLGLCLREWQVPSLVPVFYRGEMSYLSDDGSVASYEAVGT
jgi:hypothetical protein